jgi:hypothetical protein
MKYILLITTTLLTIVTFGQSKSEKDTTNANPNYDKALAEKLGADDYGMKSYFMVILTTGTNKTEDKNIISESFSGHMNNIEKLVKEGKLICSGSF